MPGLLPLGREPLGVEAERVVPELGVAVGRIGTDDDRRLRGDRVAIDVERRLGLARHAVGRRVEAHGLLDDHRRVLERPHVLQPGGPAGKKGVDLLVDPALHVGVVAKQVQRERQRRGGRLVPGQQEDEGLVPDLVVAEPLPRLGVAGADEQAHEVRPAVGVAAVVGDEVVHDLVDVGLHGVRPPVAEGRPVLRGPEGVDRPLEGPLAQVRHPVLEDRQHVLHVGAEDRLADHPQRHPRHVGAQVDGAPVGERPPAVHGLGPLLHDHRDVVAHGLVREQGLHLPLLALPHVAVGRQQPVAEELSELDVALVALVEVVGPGGQHVLDHVRVKEEGRLPVVLAGGAGKADDIAELEHRPVRRAE